MAQKEVNPFFIDTNYLLRYLLKDNNEQFTIVTELFEQAVKKSITLIASEIVLFELIWTLERFYKIKKKKVCSAVEEVLKLNIIRFENQSRLEKSLFLYKDFSLSYQDCYNIVFSFEKNIPYKKVATFDKKMLKVLKILS